MTLQALFGDNHVVRANPATRQRLARAAQRGELARLLPGLYAHTGTETHPAVLAEAIHASDPRAVLTGATAAALHVRPHQWPNILTFTSPKRWRVTAPWFSARIGAVPPEHVLTTPVPHVEPALALLQTAETEGSRVLDHALRNRQVRPGQLMTAVDALKHARGNGRRRTLALESLGNPWSDPERSFQGLLRRAGIRGWSGNTSVTVRGRTYILDVAFRVNRLAIEIDSWEYHGHSNAFESDRERHNDLVGAGWTILHITPLMIAESPDLVLHWVRTALKAAGSSPA